MKMKNLGSPWITTWIRKSSSKKKYLYEKFLKLKLQKHYKLINNIRTSLKKILKSLTSSTIKTNSKYENKIITTQKIKKEIVGKSKVFHDNFSKTLRINKPSITDKNCCR